MANKMMKSLDSILFKIILSATFRLRTRYKNKKDKLLPWAIGSPVKSTLYYTFIDDSFDNEHFKFLAGKYNYTHNRGSSGLYAQTRRNIHRIEKGISASYLKSRETFAIEYIEETINGVKYLLEKNYQKTPFHQWGFDVIDKYFSIITFDEFSENLFKQWKIIKTKFPLSESNHIQSIPYEHRTLPTLKTSFEELDDLYRRRRSVRWYNDREVDVEIIKKAVQSSLASPTACNRQPFEVLYVKGEKLEKLKELKLGFGIFSENIKSFIFIVGDLSSYIEEKDRHLIYIDGGLFAMSLMLSLEVLGVSTCPINFPDMKWLDSRVQEILDLKDYQKGVMLMSLGYVDHNSPVPFSAKKELIEIFKEIY